MVSFAFDIIYFVLILVDIQIEKASALQPAHESRWKLIKI